MTKRAMLRQQAAFAARCAAWKAPDARSNRVGCLSDEENAARRLAERKARGASKWEREHIILPGSHDPKRLWRNAEKGALKDGEQKTREEIFLKSLREAE